MQLMYAEKAGALIGAGTAMMFGMTPTGVLERLRTLFAQNEARLGA